LLKYRKSTDVSSAVPSKSLRRSLLRFLKSDMKRRSSKSHKHER